MDVLDEVLKTYEKSSLDFIGNSNSLHELGLNSKKLETAASNQILDVLNLKQKEIIYTSGNSESYSLILENIRDEKEIITDNEKFYKIGLEMDKNIKFGDVLSLVNENTYLVSTTACFCKFNCLKHIDISLCYDAISLNDFDYITIEDSIPFFGVLIKDKNKSFIPLVHGGKSTTKYRSGTASTSLIVSFAKLIRIKYKK